MESRRRGRVDPPGAFVPLAVGALIGALTFLGGSGSALAGQPTCSDVLGIANHGVHVTRDYVVGADGTGPGREGAAIPGGPAPGFHFPNGIAPGASFCNPQSQSPGFHVP